MALRCSKTFRKKKYWHEGQSSLPWAQAVARFAALARLAAADVARSAAVVEDCACAACARV